MPPTIEPFVPHLDADALDQLHERLGARRVAPALGPGWDLGTPSDWLDAVAAEWREHGASSLHERLAAHRHVRARFDDAALHLAVAEGAGEAPTALLLVHGWPSSFLEFGGLVGGLTAPAAHGGEAPEAFTVVTPSLPGFAFSEPVAPTRAGARDTAARLHAAMVALGHEEYVVHGGDLGAGVAAWLARDHPDAVTGVHLATPGLAPVDAGGERERAFAEAVATWTRDEGAYASLHATKPATLAAALADSPVGLLAWVGEKVRAWSSVAADGAPKFDRGLLLDGLTLSWCTGTIGSSLLPYWAHRHVPANHLPADAPAPAPTVVDSFGGERIPFPKPPRELAARYFSVVGWHEHGVGGHFPAVAEPELLGRRLREAVRATRAHPSGSEHP